MVKSQTEDLDFLKINSAKNLKDVTIATLNEESVWLGATPKSVLSHIKRLVIILKDIYDNGTLSSAETDPTFQAWLAGFVATVDKSYIDLTDTTDTSLAGKAKSVPMVNDAQNALTLTPTKPAALTDNSDFPASYVGQALKLARVRADESGVEFVVLDFVSNADARITNWNTAYSWGNHSAAGYLTAITKAQVEAVLVGANITSHGHNYQAPLTTSDLYLDTVNHRVGVGTITPAYKFDVRGISASDGVRSDIGFDINPVLKPTGFTAVLANLGPGNVNAGLHYYIIAYKTALGQTESVIGNGSNCFNGGAGIAVTTTADNGKVNIGVTASADPRVTNIIIFRTAAGGNSWSDYRIVATISNTTQNFIDDVADANRTGLDSYGQENTTSKQITVNGLPAMLLGGSSTSFGLGALASITSGGLNTVFGAGAASLMTSGVQNTIIGFGAAKKNLYQSVAIGQWALVNSNAGGNVAVGNNSLYNDTSGSNNIAIGWAAGYGLTIGVSNIAIGLNSGRSLINGNYNVCIGDISGYHASQKADATNSIAIGYNTYTAENNSVVLGNTSIVRTYLRGYLNVSSQTPASATASGNAGDIAFDDNYIYRCIAANTWKRSPLTTW